MDEFLKDWIGTIAVLVYLVYPILKRWRDRRKQTASSRSPDAEAETKGTKRSRPRAPKRRAKRTRGKAPKRETAQRPSARGASATQAAAPPPSPKPKLDLTEMTRAQAAALSARANALLDRAKASPRLVRLVPALRDDLIQRLNTVEESLSGSPTASTIMQEAAMLRGLEELFRYLETMADQRLRAPSSVVGDADRMADACYAPILDFAHAQGLDLTTSQPIVVKGDWPLAIVPRFASTRVAPLRVPAGFGSSVWLWPSIAHEVAHDLYYSLGGLDDDLHARLGLPDTLSAPAEDQEVDRNWLRQLYGAWLVEVFADVFGTLNLGPAYVQTMRRTFRDPTNPQRTAAIRTTGGKIDEHPPPRLRLYIATRVLHHLGRHEEADTIWEAWEAEHAGVGLYFLPLGGRWVGLSDEPMHAQADAMVDALLEQPWPELAGYRLTNIPGFAYLHADHAEVERLIPRLANGETVDSNVRWIIAAAVLATEQHPTRRDTILRAARRSIEGVGEDDVVVEAVTPLDRSASIGDALVASLRRPSALREAIVLGEAIRPHRRRWVR